MMNENLLALLQKLSARPRVAVIGDCMWDRYVYCDVLGISPEDDIAPKLRISRERGCPGGAANVAVNLASLGARTSLFSACGRDATHELLRAAVTKAGVQPVLLDTEDRGTTIKTRIVTLKNHKHICRIDREVVSPISNGAVTDLLAALSGEHARIPFDIFVLSDYAKGVVVREIISWLQGKTFLVDPKGGDFHKYGKALVLTPNEKEAHTMALFAREHSASVSSGQDRHSVSFVALKRAGRGASLRDCVNQKTVELPVRAREVGDPAGCGDSFIAALATALASGVCMEDAARLAVACGACCVDHEGVHAVTIDELRDELGSFDYEGAKDAH
jgi:D-beta-D-heptose 7-phosphate kinase/D-beta-D-heptose 1-phosphate adenosyltransferase